MTITTEYRPRVGEIVQIHLPGDILHDTSGIVCQYITERLCYVWILGRAWSFCIGALRETKGYTHIPPEFYGCA